MSQQETTSESLRDSPIVIIAGVVLIVGFLLASATAIYIAQPEQAAVIIPVLISAVVPAIIGLMALARSDRSVAVASQAKEQATVNTRNTEAISAQVDGRMSQILALLQTTATSQVAQDEMVRIIKADSTRGMTTVEKRTAEDTTIVRAAEDLVKTREREDTETPKIELPPFDKKV